MIEQDGCECFDSDNKWCFLYYKMGIILEYCPILLFHPPVEPEHEIPLLAVPKPPLITFNDFEIEGKLGEGGFGAVFLGQLKQNMEKGITEKFAIKLVSKKKLRQHNVIQNAFSQKIIAMYNHPFIVSLLMSFQDQWYIYFVLEYAPGGDTYGLIKKNTPKFEDYRKLGQGAVKFVVGCVILGLQYVHKNDYMYRDLKPENVMVFENGYVKISDFGLAKKTVHGRNNRTILGTRFYYAPEMLLRKGYDKRVDLWALGVYLYQMSSYQIPFKTEQITPQRFQSVCRDSEANRVWHNPDISNQLKDLIHNLLRFDPNLRLGSRSWDDIKSHAFFNGFDWELLKQQKMASPIKHIISKYPTQLKEYKPELYDIKKTGQRPNIEGWSYYGKYAK